MFLTTSGRFGNLRRASIGPVRSYPNLVSSVLSFGFALSGGLATFDDVRRFGNLRVPLSAIIARGSCQIPGRQSHSGTREAARDSEKLSAPFTGSLVLALTSAFHGSVFDHRGSPRWVPTLRRYIREDHECNVSISDFRQLIFSGELVKQCGKVPETRTGKKALCDADIAGLKSYGEVLVHQESRRTVPQERSGRKCRGRSFAAVSPSEGSGGRWYHMFA